MKTNAKTEALRRLGAPSCAGCGNVGAHQRRVTIQHILNEAQGLNDVNRVESDHFLLLCSGCGTREIIGTKVYVVVSDGRLSAQPDPDQNPFGVVLRVEPLIKNGDAIGVEMRPK